MTELNCDIDLYDTELVQVRAVGVRLRQWVGSHRDLEGFRREAIERFEDIGLHARVVVYEDLSGPEPVYHPEITIVGRIERVVFDHDQMRHEVRANVIGRAGHEDISPLVVSVPPAATP